MHPDNPLAHIQENLLEKHKAYIALTIWVIAIAMKAVTLGSIPQPESIDGDARKYAMVGSNIVDHGVYTQAEEPPFKPDTTISPGYPLIQAFIAFISDGFEDFIIKSQSLNIILSSLSPMILFFIAAEFRQHIAGILAGLLYAFSPHANVFAYYLLTETPFILWMLLSLLFFSKGIMSGKLAPLVGFAFFAALAALTRPAFLLFPLSAVTLGLVSLRKSHSRPLLISSVIFVLLVSLWPAYKAYLPEDQAKSLAGAAIFLGSYPDMRYKGEKKQAPYENDPDWPVALQSPSKAAKLVIGKVKEDPEKYLSWYLLGKPAFFWRWEIFVGYGGPFVYPVQESLYDPGRWGHNLVVFYRDLHPFFVWLAFLLPLGVLAANHKKLSKETATALFALWLLPAYFTFVHSVLAPLPRYSVPLHGPVYLITCISLALLVNSVIERRIQEKGQAPVAQTD